jgi:HlyD family secretion protein
VVKNTGEVLKIPSQALRFRPQGASTASGHQNANQAGSAPSATVWMIDNDGQPGPVAVKLDASDDNGAALLESPLTDGQQLIIGAANTQNQRKYFGIRLGF